MHNAERTEARLNYSTVSGLTYPTSRTLDSTCRFQAAPSFYLPCISVFLASSQVHGSTARYIR